MVKMLARILNNTIVEIHAGFGNFSVHECYHPSVLAQCIPLPEGAEVGWVKQEDGTWVAPSNNMETNT